ncbi:MAG TPA: CDGSH iron-sulfur domain-containing protein [Actinotalea sp.]|nr:CDGSH iron-sulfur domain-containing protein [Actinotalea sp.]
MTADEEAAGRRDRPGRARITLCPDGPVLVRGPVELLDESGGQVAARRRTVALCRCGGSAIKPWCDGTHKVNGYRSADG